MANSVSAKKRIRRNNRRAEVNGARRSRIRTYIKRIELALGAGNAKDAEEAFEKARPEVDRGVAKGIMHKKTASRKLSRLSARIRKLKGAA